MKIDEIRCHRCGVPIFDEDGFAPWTETLKPGEALEQETVSCDECLEPITITLDWRPTVVSARPAGPNPDWEALMTEAQALQHHAAALLAHSKGAYFDAFIRRLRYIRECVHRVDDLLRDGYKR